MIDQMSGMRSAIEDKIDLLSRKKGMTKEQIWQFISNQANFSDEEWKVIKNENQSMIDKVWGIVEGHTVSTDISSKSGNAGSRKGKYVGARRNWIPTR